MLATCTTPVPPPSPDTPACNVTTTPSKTTHKPPQVETSFPLETHACTDNPNPDPPLDPNLDQPLSPTQAHPESPLPMASTPPQGKRVVRTPIAAVRTGGKMPRRRPG